MRIPYWILSLENENFRQNEKLWSMNSTSFWNGPMFHDTSVQKTFLHVCHCLYGINSRKVWDTYPLMLSTSLSLCCFKKKPRYLNFDCYYYYRHDLNSEKNIKWDTCKLCLWLWYQLQYSIVHGTVVLSKWLR